MSDQAQTWPEHDHDDTHMIFVHQPGLDYKKCPTCGHIDISAALAAMREECAKVADKHDCKTPGFASDCAAQVAHEIRLIGTNQ